MLVRDPTVLEGQVASARLESPDHRHRVFYPVHRPSTNAVGTQTRTREARNNPAIEKKERIDRLDTEIANATKAYQQIAAHEYVTAATVKSAEAALENLKKSAYDECHTGTFGMTRGKNCEALEKRRDAKAEEVEKLQRNADLTERATDIEIEITKFKTERKDLGAVPEHIDAEMEGFAASSPTWAPRSSARR